ncbi:TPA: phage tail protein [Photobacterium damselae]
MSSNTTSKVITTKAGEALIAQMQAENKVLVIDKFIFANVPNRPDFPQREDLLPTEHVVHESAVHEQGRMTENSVIYSTTLASNVGPFTFNWSGLYCSEHNTLVAINFPAAVDKTVDGPGVTGNTLVRSFVLEYKGIAETTNITVDPASWQYDAHKRMSKMDNDSAQAIIDQNGKDWFIDDGFIVTPQSTAYNIKAGAGYVSGHRITLDFDRIVQAPIKPSFIYVDAYREGNPTGEWVTKFNFVVSPDEKDDYTDAHGVQHFVSKIAQVMEDGSVVSLRKKDKLDNYVESINNLHTTRDAIEWRPNLKVKTKDALRLFSHTDEHGVKSYYLPNVDELPFVTADVWENDVALNRFEEDSILTAKTGVKIIDSASDFKHLNFNNGQVVITKGRLKNGDGFGAKYIIKNEKSDGFFNLATANNLTAMCESDFSLRMCGAFGNFDIKSGTGDDDSDAIEFFFNQLEEYTGDKSGFEADWEAQSLYAKTIKVEAGNYLLTRKIKRGVGGTICHQALQCESGAFIHADIPSVGHTDYAIELHQLRSCNINLHVRSETCGALLIDTAFNCDLNLNVGCLKGESALKYQGVIFNCSLKHKLNQNVAMSSIGVDPDSWMLLADFSNKTHLDWTGMVICKFERILAAGGGRGIKLLGGGMTQSPIKPSPISNVEIGILEAEGITNVALEVENFNNLTFRNQWTEASGGHPETFVLSFKYGVGLKLDNIKVGELRDNLKIHGVSGIIIDNVELGALLLGGSIYGLQINNPRFKRSKPRDFIKAIDDSGYYLSGLNLNNPISITNDGVFSKIFPSVRSCGTQSASENYINDITLKTGAHAYYGALSNGTNKSPLNIMESVFTVSGQGRYPSLMLDIKDVAFDFDGHIIYAIKSDVELISSGIVNDNSIGVTSNDGYYGTYHFRSGDWHLFITEVNVRKGNNNKIDIVWNYGDKHIDGTEFKFGGAMMFSGLDIRIPQ